MHTTDRTCQFGWSISRMYVITFTDGVHLRKCTLVEETRQHRGKKTSKTPHKSDINTCTIIFHETHTISFSSWVFLCTRGAFTFTDSQYFPCMHAQIFILAIECGYVIINHLRRYTTATWQWVQVTFGATVTLSMHRILQAKHGSN